MVKKQCNQDLKFSFQALDLVLIIKNIQYEFSSMNFDHKILSIFHTYNFPFLIILDWIKTLPLPILAHFLNL
jgi:hypothetical protein